MHFLCFNFREEDKYEIDVERMRQTILSAGFTSYRKEKGI